MSSVDYPSFDGSRFKLGVLCNRLHDWNETGQSLRYLKCNSCVECKAITDKRRHERDREKVNEYNKRYRKENPEKVKEWNRRYWEKSPVPYAEYVRLQRKANPERFRRNDRTKYYRHYEKYRAYRKRVYQERKSELHAKQLAYMRTDRGKMLAAKHRHNRRARNQSVIIGAYTPKELLALKEVFDNLCAYCCDKTAKSLDHFIPVSKGGSDCLGNLLPCCRSCNSSKCNSDPFEWYSRQDFFSKQQWKKILKTLGKTEDNYQQIPLL